MLPIKSRLITSIFSIFILLLCFNNCSNHKKIDPLISCTPPPNISTEIDSDKWLELLRVGKVDIVFIHYNENISIKTNDGVWVNLKFPIISNKQKNSPTIGSFTGNSQNSSSFRLIQCISPSKSVSWSDFLQLLKSGKVIYLSYHRSGFSFRTFVDSHTAICPPGEKGDPEYLSNLAPNPVMVLME